MPEPTWEPVQPGLFTEAGLLGGACGACGRRHFPRADICPWCGCAGQVEEVTLSPTGTLWGWTAVTAAPPGYDGPVPYGFGVVELPADGLRVVTRLVESDPAQLVRGTPMRFRIVPLTPPATTPAEMTTPAAETTPAATTMPAAPTVTWAFERA